MRWSSSATAMPHLDVDHLHTRRNRWAWRRALAFNHTARPVLGRVGLAPAPVGVQSPGRDAWKVAPGGAAAQSARQTLHSLKSGDHGRRFTASGLSRREGGPDEAAPPPRKVPQRLGLSCTISAGGTRTVDVARQALGLLQGTQGRLIPGRQATGLHQPGRADDGAVRRQAHVEFRTRIAADQVRIGEDDVRPHRRRDAGRRSCPTDRRTSGHCPWHCRRRWRRRVPCMRLSVAARSAAACLEAAAADAAAAASALALVGLRLGFGLARLGLLRLRRPARPRPVSPRPAGGPRPPSCGGGVGLGLLLGLRGGPLGFLVGACAWPPVPSCPGRPSSPLPWRPRASSPAALLSRSRSRSFCSLSFFSRSSAMSGARGAGGGIGRTHCRRRRGGTAPAGGAGGGVGVVGAASARASVRRRGGRVRQGAARRCCTVDDQISASTASPPRRRASS